MSYVPTDLPDIFEKIRPIVAGSLRVPIEQVGPETYFVEDLGVNPERVSELFMTLEERLDIQIPQEDRQWIIGVGELLTFLSHLVGNP